MNNGSNWSVSLTSAEMNGMMVSQDVGLYVWIGGSSVKDVIKGFGDKPLDLLDFGVKFLDLQGSHRIGFDIVEDIGRVIIQGLLDNEFILGVFKVLSPIPGVAVD